MFDTWNGKQLINGEKGCHEWIQLGQPCTLSSAYRNEDPLGCSCYQKGKMGDSLKWAKDNYGYIV